jgi:exodeoxyribonuclease VII small subunit
MAVKKSNESIDYQALRAELDEILDQLQNDEVDIEVAISKYERGQVIVKQLQQFLNEAENKITKLKLSSVEGKLK